MIIMDRESGGTLPEMAEIWQETLNWQPTIEQGNQLQKLYDLIVLANRQINLTRITEPKEFWEKHLWDSLRGVAPQQHFLPELNAAGSIIDIGSGAGFPGLPIGIVFPHYQVTLLDSTRKKVNFINSAIEKLPLSNATTILGRAEEIGQDTPYREKYNLAVIRAVASASICSEYALPLIKKGGLAIIYRGTWTQEENQNLEHTANILGARIELIDRFTTPLTKSVRHCVYLRKVLHTPISFPRPVGVPTQNPL